MCISYISARIRVCTQICPLYYSITLIFVRFYLIFSYINLLLSNVKRLKVCISTSLQNKIAISTSDTTANFGCLALQHSPIPAAMQTQSDFAKALQTQIRRVVNSPFFNFLKLNSLRIKKIFISPYSPLPCDSRRLKRHFQHSPIVPLPYCFSLFYKKSGAKNAPYRKMAQKNFGGHKCPPKLSESRFCTI